MSRVVLQLEDLTVSYNRIPAVHHLSAAFRTSTIVAVLGPNGAGKTTLLKAIAGLLPIETGRILPETPGSRRVAYVPQRERVDWDFPVTVRGLVEMGRFESVGIWGRFRSPDDAVVDEAIAICDLGELADRQISALSGGQQQRAFLARAWAQQAGIYLLDEPFTGLDRNAAASFAAALRRLRDAGKLILASHHDLKAVPSLFDEVLLLNGELVAAGSVAEAFTPENIEQTFETHVFSGTHTHA
ncbi:MAG: metal ABC transporter ATP-binding protein [Terrimicrobiaceae bacterium]|nr:metal ABC transporter ATP-binding protein [Terrimicrobiaceae bacterium]